jgi:hypothetical protein
MTRDRTEEDQIGSFFKPAVAGRERHHLGLADHGHGLEVERLQGLADRQPRVDEVPLDAAPVALGDLVFAQRRQEAGRRPAFLVGLVGEPGPQELDRRQAEFRQHQLQAGGIDGIGGLHAASPTSWTVRHNRTVASARR